MKSLNGVNTGCYGLRVQMECSCTVGECMKTLYVPDPLIPGEAPRTGNFHLRNVGVRLYMDNKQCRLTVKATQGLPV